jgi:hypothetical protein
VKKSSILIAVLALVMTLGLMGCASDGGNDAEQMNTLEKIKEQGYVTVGFANEQPYAYATPDGQLCFVTVAAVISWFFSYALNQLFFRYIPTFKQCGPLGFVFFYVLPDSLAADTGLPFNRPLRFSIMVMF